MRYTTSLSLRDAVGNFSILVPSTSSDKPHPWHLVSIYDANASACTSRSLSSSFSCTASRMLFSRSTLVDRGLSGAAPTSAFDPSSNQFARIIQGIT